MKLENIVPWGRNKTEYMEMFSLSEDDVKNKRILGCGDGPSSFNAELYQEGGQVVSIDPLYAYDKQAIQKRINEVREDIMNQMRVHIDNFVWRNIPDIDYLEKVRMKAMMEFLNDYEDGKKEGRYVNASLPNLPFKDNSFDLALSSHLLFLYSDHLNAQFHKDAFDEMLRVSKEVRVFPLVTLSNEPSPHVDTVVDYMKAKGYIVEVVKTNYEFQKGGNKMLRVMR